MRGIELKQTLTLLILVFIVACTGAQTSPQSRVTLSIGHAGAAQAVTGRRDLDLGFSAGADGKLLVWSLEHAGLHASWQVDGGPLTHVAVHPERPEAVVFVRDGIAAGRIIGVNWETGEHSFVVPVGNRVTTLEYSPQGSFIVFTLPGFDSLRVLDSADGTRLPYIEDAFGTVSFVQIARSERNLMTYVPSRGEFIYWELQTGRELQTVATRTRLTHLTLVDPQTQRYLAGFDGTQLVIVDNLSGDVRATYPVSPVHGISYDAESDRFLVVSDQNGRRNALAFTYSAGRLRRDFYRPQSFSPTTTSLAAVGSPDTRGFLAGASDGEVAFYERRNGRRTLIGPANDSRVVDLTFSSGTLYVSLGDRLISLESDLFDDRRTSIEASYFTFRTQELGGLEGVRIVADADAVLLWAANRPGVLFSLAPESDEPSSDEPSSELPVVYEDPQGAPIARVRPNEEGVLILYRDGRIVQIDRETRDVVFRYTSIGAQDAIWDRQLGLVVAKSRATAFDTSVVQVDQRTRETVAADTDAFLTVRLALDAGNQRLYAVGLHGSQSAPTTRILQFDGRGFGRTTRLYQVDAERARADIVWDERSGSLLSTIEHRRVVRHSQGRAEFFAPAQRMHGELAIGANLTVALNLDGTVTAWDRESGEILADYVVIGDEWVLLSPYGVYLTSSPAAEEYLTFIPVERTRLSLSDFRMRLPLSP